MRGSWQRSVAVVLTVVATLALMAEENEATAAGGARVACAALLAPSDTTEMVGLTFKDDDIYRAIVDFEAGNRQESIKGLTKLLNDKAAGDASRRRELQLAISLLQLRTGEQKDLLAAKGTLSTLANLGGETDLARRAQVLKLIADNKVKDGTSGVRDLAPRENWIEHLRHARVYLETRLDEQAGKMENATGRADWGTIRDGLKHVADCMDQMEVIHLDEEDTSESIGACAGRIGALAKELAKSARDRLEKVEDLKNEGRIDANGSNRGRGGGGYKRAGQINENLRAARAEVKWAEEILKAYRKMGTGRGKLFPTVNVTVPDVPAKDVV